MTTELGNEDGHTDARVRLEAWQSLLLTCVSAFVWSTDRELRITASAGSKPCAHGPTLEEIVRAPLGEALRAGDRSSVPVAMHLRAMRGEPATFDHQWSHRFFHCRVAAMRDDRQAIIGCAGVAVDKTSLEEERRTMARIEQRHARQRLRSATSLLEAALESTTDGLLVVDLHGNIVKSNARFAAIWHIPRSLVVAGDDERAISFVQDQTTDPDSFRESIRKVYDDPEHASHDELLLKDGRVLERYSLPQRVDGVPVGRVWSFRDVTLRKRAEAARDRLLYAEREAREVAQRAAKRASLLAEASRLLASLDYESALASVASLVTVWFAEWCALDMIQPDGSTRRIARSSATNGCSMLPCRPAEHDVALREEAEQAVLGVPLATTGKLLGSMRFGRRRGHGFDSADLALAEDLAGRAALTCAIACSYRRTEEALRARDEFLSVASHEIRAPLASLQTAADALLVGAYTDGPISRVSPLDKPLRLIVRQVGRLARLADDLFDAVSIASAGVELTRTDADFSAIVAGAVERAKAELGAKAAAITLEVSGPIPGQWDRRRIAQLVTTLLSNAVRYGAGTPIAVRVERRDDHARLSVRDGGIGIAPDRLPTLFQRFDRAGVSHDYGGLGLGLYIAHAIVAAHGGVIDVESAPGKGSTFIVTLPLQGAR